MPSTKRSPTGADAPAPAASTRRWPGLRILCVSPYYEPEGGGLERYAHAILSRLAGRGHEASALAFTRRQPETVLLDGVQLERVRPRFVLGNTPIDPKFPRTVADALRRERPDVLLAHTPVPFPAEMAFRAARAARVPFVLTYHAGRLQGSNAALGAFAALDRWTLERRMIAHSDALIAVSPYARDTALRRHAARATVIPPGVDLSRLAPDGPPEPNSILFVGPLSSSYRWKGIDVLWEAFTSVALQLPDATLTIVGDGDRMAEFQDKATELQDRVRLLGRVSDAALLAEYGRAAVLCLPSTTDAESFGMVLAEANACARPVVASRIGGIPDFVTHGENGLLARPGDPHDLAEKLLTVLLDESLAARLGTAGLERVRRDHDWGPLAQRTEEVLLRVVGGARVPKPEAVTVAP